MAHAQQRNKVMPLRTILNSFKLFAFIQSMFPNTCLNFTLAYFASLALLWSFLLSIEHLLKKLNVPFIPLI